MGHSYAGWSGRFFAARRLRGYRVQATASVASSEPRIFSSLQKWGVRISSSLMHSEGLSRRAAKTIFVAINTDRCSASLDYLNARLDCKISAKDVNGDYCIYDTVRTKPGGPPLHIHHDQDEWFFVSEGEFIFQVGDERLRLTDGDSVLGPRKVPHAFANVSETGRLLILYQPAGTIEQFFLDSQNLSKSSSPTLDAWQAVARRHRIEILGPPLKLE